MLGQKKSLKFLIMVILCSLIIGGLAGAGSSYLFLQNLDKLGLAQKENGGLKFEKVEKVVEQDIESATINVVKEAQPSVVSIIISKKLSQLNAMTLPQDLFNQFFGGSPFELEIPNQIQPNQATPKSNGEQLQEIGGGSGFIISDDGMILTNKHVVADAEATYTVVTNDGQKYLAKVLGRDSVNDLAVIKIEAKGLKPLKLGDSDKIEIGQTVIAIGNTLSEFRNTVTRGVISGVNRRVEASGFSGFSEILEEAIQTDAAINPGNSGGPLLNLKGEVIGINTAINQAGQLVGFAIPINEAKQVISSIQKYGKIVRPYLGVRYILLDDQIAKANDLKINYGALVISGRSASDLAVVPGSPADKAGIVENDIILEVNGTKINENHSLSRLLSNYNPGDEVSLKIWHKGEEKTVKVKLVERPEEK
jgi:serine protease Do